MHILVGIYVAMIFFNKFNLQHYFFTDLIDKETFIGNLIWFKLKGGRKDANDPNLMASRF